MSVFEPIKLQHSESHLGLKYTYEDIIIFFGKKALHLENLNTTFPNLHFKFLNQTHSTIISSDISTCNKSQQALSSSSDGHIWHNLMDTAIVIKTADCLPLISYNHINKTLCVLHCGRKGIVNGIISKFKNLSNLHNPHTFFIGPHIRHYIIDSQLAHDLIAQDIPHIHNLKNKKFTMDLNKIVRDQIKHYFTQYEIKDVEKDTLTNDEFWSYRQNKKTSYRNLSFAAQVTK